MSDNGIRITGELTKDAEVLYQPGTNGTTAMLELHLSADKGLPYVVRQMLGADPSVHIAASAKLAILRRGSKAAVYAIGLRAQSDHSIARLMALGVSDVLALGSISRSKAGDN